MRRYFAVCLATALLAAGCVSTREPDGGEEDGSLPAPGDAGADGAGDDAESPEPDAGGSEAAACSVELAQASTKNVDVLFVIDTSESLAEEQKKLVDALPEFVRFLATGRSDASSGGGPSYAVDSLHLGVITTDLGVNLAPLAPSCGGASYDPVAPDPANTNLAVQMMPPNNVRLDKPFGDNGQLLTSTAVAVQGIWARPYGTTFSTPVAHVVQPDPACASIMPQRFVAFDAAGGDLEKSTHALSCIAKRGKNGCAFEQQLESMYKALAPSTEMFSRNTHGHGSGSGAANAGFLRPDAVLAIIHLSDDDDCSIPDSSSDLLDRTAANFTDDVSVRCGKPDNQPLLHPIARYVDGLRALKAEPYQDRIIFASIVGIPMGVNLGGEKAHSGKLAIDAILSRTDMQFATRSSSVQGRMEPVPTCVNPAGDGPAAPARRLLETAAAFGDNGVVGSVCENEYGSTLREVGTKISAQLGGTCLPGALPVVDGKVECDLVEILSLADSAACSDSLGRSALPDRDLLGVPRTSCQLRQLAVEDGAPESGAGWYYDSSSEAVREECAARPQRLVFTRGAEPRAGARVFLECPGKRAAQVDQTAVGRDAVNLRCTNDAVCTAYSDMETLLACVAGHCQIQCETSAECPDDQRCVGASTGVRRFCFDPGLCPL